jgi:hypothetical protein
MRGGMACHSIFGGGILTKLCLVYSHESQINIHVSRFIVHIKFEPISMQEKKVRVFEFIPMDLFDKAKEIAMTSILVLYNTNLGPFAICAMPNL